MQIPGIPKITAVDDSLSNLELVKLAKDESHPYDERLGAFVLLGKRNESIESRKIFLNFIESEIPELRLYCYRYINKGGQLEDLVENRQLVADVIRREQSENLKIDAISARVTLGDVTVIDSLDMMIDIKIRYLKRLTDLRSSAKQSLKNM